MKNRKNLTIKLRITLWYTVFMTLLVAAVVALLLVLSHIRVHNEAQLRLTDAVERSFAQVSLIGNTLYFDDDLNYMAQGVSISVYNKEGMLLYGRIPAHFDGADMLIKDEMQSVRAGNGSHWYVYDTCRTVEGFGTLWVRGITSQDTAEPAFSGVIVAALIVLPFFVLTAVIGGYLITRRTLRPLDAMTRTAQSIATGEDLTARIRLSRGDDEIHTLAHTFDGMMERLQTSFENEKQFTSDVSHELRTPVAAILSQCEYASRPDSTEEELRQSLGGISAQARRMSALIAQLLLLARAESGKQVLQKESVDLTLLTEMVAEEQRTAAQARNIALHTELAEEVIVTADEAMLMRLLINLLANAIAYGREGGNIWVTLAQAEDRITLAVRDDGIGIAPEHLEKIWNRFYQADPARSANRTGAGLGLPMVRWIARAHGGEVTAESAPDQGSTFTLTLPRR